MNFIRKFCLTTLLIFTISLGFSTRIAFLSDLHVSPNTPNDSALRLAIKEINNIKPDAVIVGGDISNEGSDEQIINVSNILKSLQAPLYIIPGNHENNWSQSATKTFNDVFGSDRFVFRIDSLIVVGINCGPYMKMGDGHVKQEDLHWLRSTLNKIVKPGDKVLSINHYPIRENDLDNYMDYAAVLADFPVIGHINGHYHSWISYPIEDLPGIMCRALDMRKSNYGYTIIEIDNNWTHIYDKQLGKNKKPKFAFANNSHHPKLKKKISEISSNISQLPENWKITKVWGDSASIFTRICLDDKNIYFGTSIGETKAIRKDTGKLRWRVNAPDTASLFAKPTRLKNNFVVFPYSSGIMFVDTESGKIIKQESTPGSPYVADGIVVENNYYQGGYKCFEARDAKSGKLKWRFKDINNYCQAQPSTSNDIIVFGAWDTNLRALSTKDGKLKWIWNNGKTANMYSPGNVVPVIANKKVIIVAPDRYMTALDLNSGKQLWRDNSHRYRESLGMSEDGKIVYAKTMDGELIAVSTESSDFKELWMCDMTLGYDHAPCMVLEKNGVVYCGSRNGRVAAVDANTHKLLWISKLGNSEINGFELDPTSDDIYISLIEGLIYCISRN